MGLKRIDANDKRVINGQTDVNQLVPFKYKWAWEKYLATCANHWMPQEVSMQKDIMQWKTGVLTEDEKRLVTRNLGFFTTADSLAANNIVLGTYRQITAPECRQFLLRQAFEEAIHCYVSGTEVLTDSGFKDFRVLTKDDKVAQWHKDGTIDFVYPDEILHDEYRGTIYSFHGEQTKYNVTPNHRCVVTDTTEDSNGDYHKEISIVTAKELFSQPRNGGIPLSGWHYNGRDEFSSEDLFGIAYALGGSLTEDADGTVNVVFAENVYAAVNRTKDNAEWKHITDNQELVNKYAVKDFSWLIPSEVSGRWIVNFFARYWPKMSKDTKANLTVLAKMDALAALANMHRVHLSTDNSTVYQHCNTHIHDNRETLTKVKRSLYVYDGMVHCVGVPTGMIIVRFDGKVSVSGNTHAYQYIVESLGLDEAEVFNAYNEIKSIKDKDEFLIPFINALTDPEFKTGTLETDQQLLKSLIVFACIMEGLFFYVGFVQILALGRQNKMSGAAEQYQYILRDESMHCNFGIDLINTIKLENPHIWTDAFKAELIALFQQAVELEYAYAEDTMPRGVLGLNATMFKEYLRFICNRRTTQIGLPELFPGVDNPFPWMSEMIDLKKEKNFFETRVIEYQSGGALNWD